MIRTKELRITLSTILLLTWNIVAANSSAQNPSVVLPENAHAISFGSGWECNNNFRAVAGKCSPITMPDNAYATNTTYGRGWECGYGYREANGRCAAINVPENAYLSNSSYGEGWECEREFVQLANTCQPIQLPENAYLSKNRDSNGWQ